MNFKFTKKKAAIFIAALVVAGAGSALFENNAVGLAIMLAAVAYLSQAA